jgi:hypothetical protein
LTDVSEAGPAVLVAASPDRPVAAASRTALSKWGPVAACVAVAFVFRLVIGHAFQVAILDSGQYTSIASNLAHGHGYSEVSSPPYVPSDLRLPGYPLLLALGYLVSDSNSAMIVVNALLGAVSTLLVFLISEELGLSYWKALTGCAISALFFSTASLAGVAAAENLSVPAVLAFVYVVLLRPRRSRLSLFVLGSLFAWLVAFTRYELVVFVLIAGVLAGRRARLKPLVTIGLCGCFLLGPAAWVLRNDITVHRLEFGDSILADKGLYSSVNPKLGVPILEEGNALLRQREVTPAERARYKHEVYSAMGDYLRHHFSAFVSGKFSAAIEYPFPPPIYGLGYANGLTATLERLAWSLFLLAGYTCAVIGGRRWWKTGRRWNVVAVGLFPAFSLCLVPLIDAVQRYWLPSLLVLIPAAVVGAAEVPRILQTVYRALLPPRAVTDAG